MLTVPSSIKALFIKDNVHKNFRVHFPNGEYSDITNENVVAESVRFTESLCSQDVFKFGLAEASVLEFEAVGVGKMLGMTIEAGIEIDCSSLSDADITAIQADPGDGVLLTDYKPSTSLPTAVFESGDISTSTGADSSDSSRIRTIGYIYADSVDTIKLKFYLANAAYTYARVFYYDSNFAYLSYGQASVSQSAGRLDFDKDFSLPVGTAYIRVVVTYNAQAISINYPFYSYRIPYGTFVVTDCPRNHEAMAHRQVTAYSPFSQVIDKITQYPASDYEKGKDGLWRKSSFDAVNVYAWLASRIGGALPSYITENFTRSLLYSTSNFRTVTFTDWDSEVAGQAQLVMNAEFYATDDLTYPTSQELWEINIGTFDTAGALAFINNAVDTYGDALKLITSPRGYFTAYMRPRAYYGTDPAYYDANGVLIDYFNLKHDESVAYMYQSDGPFSGGNEFFPSDAMILFPKHIRLDLYVNNTLTDTFETTATVAPTIYELTPNTPFQNVYIRREPSQTKKITHGAETYTAYRYQNRFSVLDKLVPALEIEGKFCKYKRTSDGIEFISLGTSPYSYSASEYQVLWWDEYDIDPVGTVDVTYTDEDNEVEYSVSIGNGTSVYAMEDNSVIARLAGSQYDISNDAVTILGGQADAEYVIEHIFKPKAINMGFTPIEATAIGMPWLEAGDKLQFTAGDGTVVTTYLLRRELSGIQHLVDTIEAKGGEVIMTT